MIQCLENTSVMMFLTSLKKNCFTATNIWNILTAKSDSFEHHPKSLSLNLSWKWSKSVLTLYENNINKDYMSQVHWKRNFVGFTKIFITMCTNTF